MSYVSYGNDDMKRLTSFFPATKWPPGVAGGSGGRGLCHRWHCGSFGWELGGFGIGVGGCVLVSRFVNHLAKNLIYSLLENTTIGKNCVSFLQIGGSESD